MMGKASHFSKGWYMCLKKKKEVAVSGKQGHCLGRHEGTLSQLFC